MNDELIKREALIERIDSQITFNEHIGDLTGINVLMDCRAALSQSEPVRYVPMTKDDALDVLGRCENETEAQVFAVVREVESEVIRRAIAQGAKLEVQE